MKFSINQTKNGLAEVQTTLRWDVQLINPPQVAGNFDEKLQIRVQTASLPEVQEETTKVELQGHTINYVGKTTKNGEITCTFVEGTDAAVVTYFTRLAAARWSGDGNDTQGVSVATNDLKFDVLLRLLDPQDQVTQSYTLVGTMARLQKNAQLGQSAEAMMPQVTFEYDDFHIDYGGISW
jgi:hypothetical protein